MPAVRAFAKHIQRAFLLAFVCVIECACTAQKIVSKRAAVGVGENNDVVNRGLSPASSDGDFFGAAQRVPTSLLSFVGGRPAVVWKDGKQRVCLTHLGPPCTGQLELSSGGVVQLGTKYVCRFVDTQGWIAFKVLDEKDAVVFSAQFSVEAQGTSFSNAPRSEVASFSPTTPCALTLPSF
jgi:hypothetical protein